VVGPDYGELSKYANRLRVESAAVQWSERDARVNSISPGIILAPLAQTELDSERDRRFER
jgi:NAD(P)-dependent dehydrogenase (short-subunit alcohol dehydrogenase family)